MPTQLIKCPSCGKDVARSAKSCPHCGKQLRMGCLGKGLILFALLALLGGSVAFLGIVGLGAAISASHEEALKKHKEATKRLLTATPEEISPHGELEEVFSLGSKYTDLQRERLEAKLTGRIVQWTLPVYEVTKVDDYYKIQTSGIASFGATPVVATFSHVYPQSEGDIKLLEALVQGNHVTVRGVISDSFMRHLVLDPAILISQ